MPDQPPTPPARPPVAIDLGCGQRKRPGAIGIDVARLPGVDIRADVTGTLPFRDNSVDEVYASHIVEHLDDLPAFMGEVWRVCKPNGLVYIRFPHATTMYGVWRDPTHKRGILLATFDYFDPNTFDGKVFGYYHSAKFRIVRKRLTFNMNSDLWTPQTVRRMAGVVIDALANRSDRAQYFCERLWGSFVGMEEGHIWLRAVK